MDKAEFAVRFQELLSRNPKAVRILRSGEEVNSLDMSKVMAAGFRTFANYDDTILTFIEECLSQGKEVAINAAGPQNLMIMAAHGLFRSSGERLPQDDVHDIMNGLDNLRNRYIDNRGQKLLIGGSDSWIYPEKYVAMAQKYRFIKHQTFNAHDKNLLIEVEGFLKRNKMVVLAAWEDRAEVYLEPEYPSPNQQQSAKSGGCFVVTAASGDEFSPEVQVLSRFRDDVLNAHVIGRCFVRIYYAASPPVASIIGSSPALRRLAMLAVVRPAIQIVRIVRRASQNPESRRKHGA